MFSRSLTTTTLFICMTTSLCGMISKKTSLQRPGSLLQQTLKIHRQHVGKKYKKVTSEMIEARETLKTKLIPELNAVHQKLLPIYTSKSRPSRSNNQEDYDEKDTQDYENLVSAIHLLEDCEKSDKIIPTTRFLTLRLVRWKNLRIDHWADAKRVIIDILKKQKDKFQTFNYLNHTIGVLTRTINALKRDEKLANNRQNKQKLNLILHSCENELETFLALKTDL